MIETIQQLIIDLAQKRNDPRLAVFDIKVNSFTMDQISLTGCVLEHDDLEFLTNSISSRFNNLRIDTCGIEVLRQPDNPIMAVATNLTSTHTSASFLAEMSSQLVYGEKIEILAEHAGWVFTRQTDGYLSYAYKPYLTDQIDPEPSHIVLAPLTEIRTRPENNAPVLTRIYCGTMIKALSTNQDWAEVICGAKGWLPISSLRALDSIPDTIEARRDQIIQDAHQMIGVPYLWGGVSANGIDCSGFARLLHNWVGVKIPRDADMQAKLCKPSNPPFLPGDLLFFGKGEENRDITHVGISLGGWDIIHSSRSRNGVYIDNVQGKESLRTTFAHGGTFLS